MEIPGIAEVEQDELYEYSVKDDYKGITDFVPEICIEGIPFLAAIALRQGKEIEFDGMIATLLITQEMIQDQVRLDEDWNTFMNSIPPDYRIIMEKERRLAAFSSCSMDGLVRATLMYAHSIESLRKRLSSNLAEDAPRTEPPPPPPPIEWKPMQTNSKKPKRK
ncbi:MAG: hypothetical protein EOP06_14795 [Proteobacteria bacterium]|nr:MAG: hypothetical protein EOP06_14795 [Pseudomonadota bacterium]